MKLKSVLLLASIVLLISPNAIGQQQTFETNTGKIHFSSEAPLESITAASSKLRGLIDATQNRFAFSIDVRTFEGFNSALQREHFNENYLESDKYNKASFSGKIIEKIDLNINQTLQVRAKGIMEIHGVSKERIIPMNIAVKDGKISFQSSFNVLLIEHNIVVPKIVNQKIAESVSIDVSGELIQKK